MSIYLSELILRLLEYIFSIRLCSGEPKHKNQMNPEHLSRIYLVPLLSALQLSWRPVGLEVIKHISDLVGHLLEAFQPQSRALVVDRPLLCIRDDRLDGLECHVHDLEVFLEALNPLERTMDRSPEQRRQLADNFLYDGSGQHLPDANHG